MTCKFDGNKVTCFRGKYPLDGMKGIVMDRQGNEWYIKYTGNELVQLDHMYPINAYDEKGKIQKRFIKNFLNFVRAVEG